MLKRVLVLLLALLFITGCQKKEPVNNSTMLVNPFITCSTLEDAEKLLGYSLELPSDLTACPNIIYRAANSEAMTLFEVIFDCNGNEIRLRKSPGTEDNSGIYEEFADTLEKDKVILRGDGDGSYRLATWQEGKYSYSISCEKSVPEESLYNWVCSTK